VSTRGRGRPSRLEAILGPRPPRLRGGTSYWQRAMVSDMQKIEADLVREYRHSAVVTPSHALDLAFAEEVGPTRRAAIMETDAQLRQVARDRRSNGGEKTRRHWSALQRAVVQKNANLLDRPRLSAMAAARIVRSTWSTRGIKGEACPNIRTLADWFRAAKKK
jgi:hypothetical protein